VDLTDRGIVEAESSGKICIFPHLPFVPSSYEEGSDKTNGNKSIALGVVAK